MKSKKREGRFGLIVSGGPAPGINCVISSSVIEATNLGYQVKGLMNGFKGLSTGEADAVIDLTPDSVSSIYNTGGSLLGTNRFNPFGSPVTQRAFVEGLAAHNIDKLIVIGGEGSAYLSYQISRHIPDVHVVHVPKTIDNDLILPNQYPSFGFETARYAGTRIIDTLMVDAKTSRRWFLVTSMGRKAGFLALGLGIASGATLTLIPEEFADGQATPNEISGIILNSIKRQLAMGKEYGVAILAEGILDRLSPDSAEMLKHCPRDELGRIRYSQIELGDVILPPLRRLCASAGADIKIIPKNIGYELRCHQPVSFDIEYTKFLGYGAVKLILEGKSGIMVTRDYDNIGYTPLEEMITDDGQVRSRKVDLASDLYTVARSFMIR